MHREELKLAFYRTFEIYECNEANGYINEKFRTIRSYSQNVFVIFYLIRIIYDSK